MEEQRYPVGITVTGAMYKDAKNLFIISVLWSDECDITIYRSFKEFKILHKRLKKVFSQDNPFRRSAKVLPRFRVRSLNQKLTNKSLKSMFGLRFLQNYCDELLTCESNVGQNAEFIDFFSPKNHDLQADFAQNCVVILPFGSLEIDSGKQIGVGNITQPFVPETYRCVATYETKDIKNRLFKVEVDEMVEVFIKDKGGWWLVETNDKHVAWFPAPYLEKCGEEEEEDKEEVEEEDSSSNKNRLFRVVRNYTPEHDDELAVSVGALVQVLQKPKTGWWHVRYHGRTGYVPCLHLQPCSDIPFLTVPGGGMKAARSLEQLRLPQGSSPGASPQVSHSQGNLLEVRSAPPSPRLCVWEAKDLYSVSLGGSTEGVSLGGSTEGVSLDGSTEGVSLDGSTEGVSLHSGGDVRKLPPSAGSILPAWAQTTPPRVPPRPFTHEVLTRCCTVTRRAILDSTTTTTSPGSL
ncbi:NADPH oxidase organizer 1-like isoform X2 [Brienomyrus brachyistius]|uniref:NADPH oxidase organizer 1-like isoform X2 n=1 Tax=Brienomyrus brachyistius TaxID=42636 RepID=UPI0020B245DE|nr:NADPH oxidase organizer 1-like isoform X2 [Brienomyrus brachyistius]